MSIDPVERREICFNETLTSSLKPVL